MKQAARALFLGKYILNKEESSTMVESSTVQPDSESGS